MEITEVIFAYGHENVQATHETTLEVTEESWLSKSGDCIIAVSADKGMNDLSSRFKDCLRKEKAEMEMVVRVDGIEEVVRASGSSQLILSHPTDMVVRKSSYVCGRTLAIKADKAARDLSRRLVERLKNPEQKVRIELTARV
ncbi:MAG: DUF371 domain-containing protein [Thermoproteota archaeon]